MSYDEGVDGSAKVTFGYDAEARLTEADTWTPDGAGGWTLTNTTRFAWDGKHLIGEFDGSNNLLRSFAWGPTGLLEITDLTGPTPVTYVPVKDATGSIVQFLDTNGNVVADFHYDAWGVRTAAGPAAGACPFGFAGMLMDATTGLYYDQARWYSAPQGRFLTPDPSGAAGGLNPDAYCGNDPVNKTDTTGLSPDGTPLTSGTGAFFEAAPTAGPAFDPGPSGYSIAAPATAASPSYISVPKSLFTPDYSFGVPDSPVTLQPLSTTYARNFMQECDIPECPNPDDGRGTPVWYATMEMTINGVFNHMPDQGFNILGVRDWHVQGTGRTFPGAKYDGYREVANLAGVGIQMGGLEVLGLGGGKAVEYFTDAGEFDAAIANSVSFSSPYLGMPTGSLMDVGDVGVGAGASEVTVPPSAAGRVGYGPYMQGEQILNQGQLELHGALMNSTEWPERAVVDYGPIDINNPSTLEGAFGDLAALQRATGLEHKLIEVDGTQMMLRGNHEMIPNVTLPGSNLVDYAHSHPSRYGFVPSATDVTSLGMIPQSLSYIVTPDYAGAATDYFASQFHSDGSWSALSLNRVPPSSAARGIVAP